MAKGTMETKLGKLKAALARGDEVGALRIAARFPRLGEHKERITRAWAAYQNADFYRGIGKDPEELFRDGIRAIRERYHLGD